MYWIKFIFTNRWFYILSISLIVAGGLGILILDRLIMPVYTNYNEGVTVPDVTKISLEEAEQVLSDYGFRFEVMDRRAHTAYPADYIIDQAPPARQIVKPNRKIYLTVNTAIRPTAVVPNVAGMSLRNATIQIENYGLSLGGVSMESGEFRNTVLRQSLAPGDTVDQGAVVDLTVSDGLGDEIVQVPEIAGLNLNEAQQRLGEVGLFVSDIHYEEAEDLAPYTIISYLPDTAEMREGEYLTLIVSERLDIEEVDEAGAIIDTGNNEQNSNEDVDPDELDNEEPDNPDIEEVNE
ncbi:MAG: PASTA domain-containing protein [Balneolaceae bacterium]